MTLQIFLHLMTKKYNFINFFKNVGTSVPNVLRFCPNSRKVKTFGDDLAPLIPHLLHQGYHGKNVVEHWFKYVKLAKMCYRYDVFCGETERSLY